MLDIGIKKQLKEIFASLTSRFTLAIKANFEHEKFDELHDMLVDFAECSDKIECTTSEGDALEFSLLKDGAEIGVKFRAIPGGHEFNSLILALLNADGKGKNLPDAFTTSRIERLEGEIKLTTYMSLSCINCPDVIQALNIISILNPNISHEAVDGALFAEEVEALGVQAVPTVFCNGGQLHVGRGGLVELLDKLEERYSSKQPAEAQTRQYDLAIAGAGPAGITAAIYSARKGLNVALVAGKIGGQVTETATIENISSVIETTGTQLARDLRAHAAQYNIDILENRTIESFEIDGEDKILSLKGGEVVKAPQLIISTGAQWRRLNIPGESENIGRGVAFCPHCDGPLFKGKKVAVIGGGNSGVEAAIDLAGTCSHVTLVEFLDSLKADTMLQGRLRALPNVTIHTSSAATEIISENDKVVGFNRKDLITEKTERVEVEGIFIQIGLSANSSLFKDHVETNQSGEIVTDHSCRSSLPGVYADGDLSDVPYKQIVISMGEGAKAALAAFDDMIRGK